MADEIILRDENHITVGAGIDNTNDVDVLMLRVDPSTSYLLISEIASSNSAAPDSLTAKRDGNHRPVIMGWNEDAGQAEEILTDEDGYLLCDILAI